MLADVIVAAEHHAPDAAGRARRWFAAQA